MNDWEARNLVNEQNNLLRQISINQATQARYSEQLSSFCGEISQTLKMQYEIQLQQLQTQFMQYDAQLADLKIKHKKLVDEQVNKFIEFKLIVHELITEDCDEKYIIENLSQLGNILANISILCNIPNNNGFVVKDWVMLSNIQPYIVDDAYTEIREFLSHFVKSIGDSFFKYPRNTKDLISTLAYSFLFDDFKKVFILQSQPNVEIQNLLNHLIKDGIYFHSIKPKSFNARPFAYKIASLKKTRNQYISFTTILFVVLIGLASIFSTLAGICAFIAMSIVAILTITGLYKNYENAIAIVNENLQFKKSQFDNNKEFILEDVEEEKKEIFNSIKLNSSEVTMLLCEFSKTMYSQVSTELLKILNLGDVTDYFYYFPNDSKLEFLNTFVNEGVILQITSKNLH